MSSDLLIGVDFGGTKIEAAALDPRGDVLARLRRPTPRDDYAASLDAVADLVAALERDLGRRGTVGVGIPGSVSPASGLVRNANSVWLNGRPFDRDLEKALGRPVRVENDANCFVASEAADGAAAGASIAFGVILGTGCGGGLAANGRVAPGRNRIAGEWGHNPLPWPTADEWPGPTCWCGKSGCLECWLSGPGLAEDHRRRTGRACAAEDVVAWMRAGDAPAGATFEAYVGRLARGLAHVVNILDPDVIVLGGGLSLLPELYPGLPERIAGWVFSDSCATPIRRNQHGDSSGVRGAARLWADPAELK
jgi:fructokinase